MGIYHVLLYLIIGIAKQIIAIMHKKTSRRSEKSTIALRTSKLRKEMHIKEITKEPFRMRTKKPPTIAPTAIR